MVAEHRRSELDNMAQGLGLDSWSYPNKRTVAEAILIERERLESTQITPEEAPREIPEAYLAEESVEEAIPEAYLAEESAEEAIPEPAWEEVVNEVVKLSPNSVRGKIQAINEMSADFDKYSHMMGQNVSSLKDSIKETSNNFQGYCDNFNDSVKSFTDTIAMLASEYKDFNLKFYDDVASFTNAVSELSSDYQNYANTTFKDSVNIFKQNVPIFRQNIHKHAIDTQRYIKEFYG